MFLRNSWYVAGLSNEVDRTLRSARILGENIVLYRRDDGLPVALEDACPHRKLPLSKGLLEGNLLECGYHGLTFDCSGACVKSPTQTRIPPGAKVHSYPIVDRWDLAWIWMGVPELADADEIPCIDNYSNPEWGKTDPDALTCACNYLYLIDNLLDPSHVAWVHRNSLAADGTENTPVTTTVSGQGLIVSRWVYDRPPPAFYEPLLKFDGNCDRLQHYEARYPALAINKSVFSPAGSGGPDKVLQPDSFVSISYNFLTPIDENSTRYHWFQMRNSDPHNEDLSRRLTLGLREVFSEDRSVLEAVHAGMANKTSPNIDLGLDAAALHFRRQLDKMIASERQ